MQACVGGSVLNLTRTHKLNDSAADLKQTSYLSCNPTRCLVNVSLNVLWLI